jgi:hypothetical protein
MPRNRLYRLRKTHHRGQSRVGSLILGNTIGNAVAGGIEQSSNTSAQAQNTPQAAVPQDSTTPAEDGSGDPQLILAKADGPIIVNGNRDGVNWGFIQRNEGGYYPYTYALPPKYNKTTHQYTYYKNSGITVATGVDLGQHTYNDLLGWGLTPDQITPIAPFLNGGQSDGSTLKGQAAWDWTQNNPPVKISDEVGMLLDLGAENETYTRVQRVYNNYSDNNNFSDLPGQAKTVLLDIAYQHGPSGILNVNSDSLAFDISNGDYASAVSDLKVYEKSGAGKPYSSRVDSDIRMLQSIKPSGSNNGST